VQFIVIKLQSIKLVFLFLLVIIMLSIGASNKTSASVFFGGAVREIPVYNVDTSEQQVAISFDAAWGADKTEEIISLLKEYNADATFFLVGFWVEDYPEMTQKIVDAGFEIGTHSNTHKNLAKLNKEQVKEELLTSKTIIENATNKNVTLFRAPFGAYNNTVIEEARNLGLTTIQWDVDSLDWKNLSASQIAMRVVNGVKPGSIVLFHNNATNIVDGLRLVLDRLTNKGYKITSIGNLLIKDDYYVDSQGKQRKK
jgi:polysaccharide deacetylase family sporulation protein PdaB